MDSNTNGTSLLTTVLAVVVFVVGCGGGVRQFPAKEPMVRDDDEKPFAPAPREYESPFVWDGADQMVFRPLARFFAVDPAGRAVNVNAFDEVPDSSWFVNRIGRSPMTYEAIERGACEGALLDPTAGDGAWVVDQGKPNGANPGFRISVPGVGKFMLKSDPEGEPERATGATAIAARFYHAAGYFAPCDSVVYFKPSVLQLKSGLRVTDNSGVTRPFDDAALAKILAGASHRDGLVRMVASKWLPGRTLGPYRYEGTRDDDPNDVVPHEDRRELRGGRLLAAWLNHFDSREQNTMDVFVSKDAKDPRVPGYVRHYILDLGDCFGSVWAWDQLSRRLGHAYYLDLSQMAEDFATFGTVERPWERARRDGGVFNYFSARDFDAEAWHGGYPNPAFTRMTEADGAWMARIIARFDDRTIAVAVETGKFDAESTAYLTAALIQRRDIILRRYLTRLSPLADVRMTGDRLCAVDLARRTRVVNGTSGYEAIARSRSGVARRLRLEVSPASDVCVTVPSDIDDYTIVDIRTTGATEPLHVHVAQTSSGLRVVGLERAL